MEQFSNDDLSALKRADDPTTHVAASHDLAKIGSA
jgi:hypothetical protein